MGKVKFRGMGIGLNLSY